MELEFTRGDSYPFYFSIKDKEGTTLTKEDIQTLTLTCRKYPDKNFPEIFSKNIEDFELGEDNCYHCEFKPEDTQDLRYDTYYFDIEVVLKNGYTKTLFSSFKLTKECTFHSKVGE